MDDCWQNIHATYQTDSWPFYTKVNNVLDAISVADVPQVTTGHGTLVPAAAGGDVSPLTPEVDLLTDRKSDDVTMADGQSQ